MSRIGRCLSATIMLVLCMGVHTRADSVKEVSAPIVGEDPSWNYLNHGTDWDFLNCNDTNLWQSPWPLDTNEES